MTSEDLEQAWNSWCDSELEKRTAWSVFDLLHALNTDRQVRYLQCFRTSSQITMFRESLRYSDIKCMGMCDFILR